MNWNSAFDEFYKTASPSERQKLEELRQLFGGSTASDWKVNGQGIGSQHIGGGGYNTHPPRFSSIEELNQALHKQKVVRPATPKVSPEVRKKEIEDELDIIRGVVPTPRGYKVNPLRIKQLMAELSQLA
jgi:hypothetical protein